MTNFIFKSANRLIKNSPITLENVHHNLDLVMMELRHQRQEHRDMSLKLEKILIDKHLQMQVDKYFDEDMHTDIPNEKESE